MSQQQQQQVHPELQPLVDEYNKIKQSACIYLPCLYAVLARFILTPLVRCRPLFCRGRGPREQEAAVPDPVQ